ncbi:MAG: OmpW family outer membrane protein [Burkholderiales bacterium]
MNTPTLFARTALALLLVGGALSPAVVQAEESPWLVRVRAVNLDSANDDSTGLDLSINRKVIPELDITYFITPQWAAELVLTYPQKHTLSAGGTEIGTLKHLPPTLTAQYHFTGLGGFVPYVGAGVNYTHFSNVDLPAGVDIKRNSFGLAVQVGVDVPLTKSLSLNVDVKKVQIKTDVSAGGATLGTFKVDPLLVGVGLGWRF